MRTLIRNVKVYDGLGSFPFISDILIEKERISKIALKIEEKADKEIDGTGLCLSPGFINTHSHSALEVFRNKEMLHTLKQGITTEIVGQDGSSVAPLTDDIVDELADNMAPLGKMIEGIDDEAMLILKKHNWPGNVRELENVIEYAVNMETGRELTAASLPSYLTENADSSYEDVDSYDMSLKDSSNMSEKNKIINALRLFEDNTKGKKECAKYLKISLSTLYRKLKEYNIK